MTTVRLAPTSPRDTQEVAALLAPASARRLSVAGARPLLRALLPLPCPDLVAVVVARCQELIAQYRDINPGLADVAVVATAERMSIQRILTVDERDSRVMRPKKGMTLVLLPGATER